MYSQSQIAVPVHRFDSGFTLIELVAVILLIGIISASVATRSFNSSTTTLQTNRDDLLAAARFAQQQAMDTQGTVRLVTTSNSVSVTRDGINLQFGSVNYPLALSGNVNLAPETTLTYNRLGESSAQNFSLSLGAEVTNVSISAAGYAQ